MHWFPGPKFQRCHMLPDEEKKEYEKDGKIFFLGCSLTYPCQLHAMFDVLPKHLYQLLVGKLAVAAFFLQPHHAHPHMQLCYQEPVRRKKTEG
jgi:hypothetical protein